MKIIPALMLLFVSVTFAFAEPQAAKSGATVVKLAKKEGVGSFLTDAKGMTLYYFTKDSPGKSVCAGDCVAKWPLYLNEKPKTPKGVDAADFGIITREDGKKQSTYKGMPLYYFFKDKAAGDTSGQEVGNVWYVIDPAKFKP